MGRDSTIFTVHRSYNYGSFLQAHALGLALHQLGCQDVKYAEIGARSLSKQSATRVLRHCKHGRFEGVGFEVSKYRAFSKCCKLFDETNARDEYGSENLLLFGSDELWNIGRADFASYPKFWGEGLHGGVKASYAVSANGALRKADLPEGFLASVKDFDYLSARDRSTKEDLERLTERDVFLVADPTLLLDRQYYESIQEDVALQSDYVLVYSYGMRIPDGASDDIRDFARAQGLLLISAGFMHEWCDVCLPVSPFGFLGLVDGAKYVVTDTFHGTLFSMIYEKDFVSFPGDNTKVSETLESLGLETRAATSGSEMLSLLQTPVDYGRHRKSKAELVTQSKAYLSRALTGEQ